MKQSFERKPCGKVVTVYDFSDEKTLVDEPWEKDTGLKVIPIFRTFVKDTKK